MLASDPGQNGPPQTAACLLLRLLLLPLLLLLLPLLYSRASVPSAALYCPGIDQAGCHEHVQDVWGSWRAVEPRLWVSHLTVQCTSQEEDARL